MRSRLSIGLVVALVVVSLCAQLVGQEGVTSNRQTPVEKPAWLEGSGDDLQIKVSGEVLDGSGRPAEDFELVAGLDTHFGRRDVPTLLDGHRFEVRIPVGRLGWFRLDLTATSPDGKRIATQSYMDYTLRQAAVDGVVLRMEPAERLVEVTVLDNGETVADAHVAAEVAGVRYTAKSNGAGVATFPLMNRDKLSQLTAWTDDFMMGGYSFYRDPPSDPLGNQHTVELGPCRSQTIRLVNVEDKTPIPNVAFNLTVRTSPPSLRYLGRTPDSGMKTNENGEAVCRWFPDWEEYLGFVQILDPGWIEAADEEFVDGVTIGSLRRSRFLQRKSVVGQVEATDGNVAGFCVNIQSFQGEEENRSDLLRAFTDGDGRFEADYLPGATYCICINDDRFVSNMIDLTPFDPATNETNEPSLDISEGQMVEVIVTSGPERTPIAHQYLNLETPHRYSWREDGRTRFGQGGRRWQITTDEQGKATTFALPGREIEGSIYTPDWRAKESAQVVAGSVTRLEFHRKVAAKRKIAGRLLLPENLQVDVNEASVEIGSVDGETRERVTVMANTEGEFEFESAASRIGIYACTKDSKAAGSAIIDQLNEAIEFQLKPTSELRGQLLGKNDAPLSEHPVWATLSVAAERDFAKPYPTSFTAARFESRTDREGNYTLQGLPCEVAMVLWADSIDGSKRGRYLTEFYLDPSEPRPREVSRLWKPENKISFSDRYERTLRDCRLSGFRMMIILHGPSDAAKEFVDANLLDYNTTEEVSSFMQLTRKIGEDPDVSEFARTQNWPIPEEGKIFACAIDGSGNEIARIMLDSKTSDSPERAAQFVRKHAPKQVDAKKKWDEAFADAKRTDRKVWARISQRYCGPCFMFTRWLDDQKELLEQDYVFLKIDDVRDLHGTEVTDRLTGGDHFGVPFHAIFSAAEEMLITSESPVGNIGHPSGYEGKKHLRKMLKETRSRLSDEQIDEIVGSLSD